MQVTDQHVEYLARHWILLAGHQLTGQLTMMLVMVCYTFTGLYLLFSA